MIGSASAAFIEAWLTRVAAMPGNPAGLRFARFGEAWAPASAVEPDLDLMNRVCGPLRPEDLPDIVGWYAELGIRPWFEVPAAPALDRALEGAGAVRVGEIGGLAGPVRSTSAPAIEIRPVDASSAELFSRTLMAGHEVPEPAMAAASARARLQSELEGCHAYLAMVGDEAAGAAVLAIFGDVALMASASTLPRFRGLGCQTALIQRRMADAAAAGCRHAVSLALLGSGSHRNLGRAGLRREEVRVVWRVGG